jgi:CAAX amino terminal protease family.
LNKKTNEKYIKNAILGFVVLFIYLAMPYFQNVPYKIFNINPDTMPMWFKISYSLLFEFLRVMVVVFALNKSLKKDFDDIKKNHKNYFKKSLKYYFIGLGVMMFSNIIIYAVFKGGIANNEEAIRKLFNISPIYVFFTATIFAPVLEELVFRRAIRNFVKYDWLFIIISGFIFGGLHVFGSIKTFADLLHLIPYTSLGISFAYILTKTDNVLVPMGLHFMHNGILIAFQFTILLIG